MATTIIAIEIETCKPINIDVAYYLTDILANNEKAIRYLRKLQYDPSITDQYVESSEP